MIYSLFFLSLIVYFICICIQVYYEQLYFKTFDTRQELIKSVLLKSILQLFSTAEKSYSFIKTSTKWKLATAKGLKSFIGMFCIVAFIFSILQFWLDHTVQKDLASKTVFEIEKTQHWLKAKVDFLTLPFLAQTTVLVILIVLASLFPVIEKLKMKAAFDKFNKALSLTFAFLSISTCFTFFGNQIGEHEKGIQTKLELHKLMIQEDNQLLAKEIREAVEDRVTSAITQNPEVKSILESLKEIQSNIHEIEHSEYYTSFKNDADSDGQGGFGNYASSFSLSRFKKSLSESFNLHTVFNSGEEYFTSSYSGDTKARENFYQLADNEYYSSASTRNSEWFYKKSSIPNNAKIRKTFTEGQTRSSFSFAANYSEYTEPIKKTIKKCYSSTFKTWINQNLTSLTDYPFFGDLLDIFFHNHIEDIIDERVDKIMEEARSGNAEGVAAELNKTSEKFSTGFNTHFENHSGINNLKVQLQQLSNESNHLTPLTAAEINRIYKTADNHLSVMKGSCRWEKLRESFSSILNNYPEQLDLREDQLAIYRTFFTDWDAYCTKKKLIWNMQKDADLETFFYQFIDGNPERKACWGFVLQNDWDELVNYYTNIAPDSKATGKPYYTLKYYCNQVGKGESFESFYDDFTNEKVGILCH